MREKITYPQMIFRLMTPATKDTYKIVIRNYYTIIISFNREFLVIILKSFKEHKKVVNKRQHTTLRYSTFNLYFFKEVISFLRCSLMIVLETVDGFNVPHIISSNWIRQLCLTLLKGFFIIQETY